MLPLFAIPVLFDRLAYHASRLCEILGRRCIFPREFRFGSSEMPTGSRLPVNGAPKIEILNNPPRREFKVLPHKFTEE